MTRWWIYQRERFPIFGHGVLILAFSASSVCFSSLLRGAGEWPLARSFLVAFVCSFFAFLQLRLADEFKDAEEDTRFRPYRAVPRGLVTLHELALLWVGTAVLQLGLTVWLDVRLLWPLAAIWVYLALMSVEFFARRWLKARPITYMWTHMLIMPLIDFYATACDWLAAAGKAPSGLFWFVAASFLNGFVLEIGRKIRIEKDEEPGVETYTFLWGRPRAVAAWLGAMVLCGVCASAAAMSIAALPLVGAGLGVLIVIGAVAGVSFLRAPTSRGASRFEMVSALWTLGLYLLLGLMPKALQAFGR